MYATDNLKALAKRVGTTVPNLCETANDLWLRTEYRKERRTWVLAEDPATVTRFNNHVNH